MEKSKSEKTRTFDYSKDKRIWLKLATGKKIKLRKYLSDIALELSKINNHDYDINRDFIIKAYNKGGLSTVKAWVDNEFEIIKNKDNGRNKKN